MPWILSGVGLFAAIALTVVFGYFVLPVIAVLGLLALVALMAFRWLRRADALPSPPEVLDAPTGGGHRGDVPTTNERVGQG